MRGGEFLRGLMLIIKYILIVLDNFLLVKKGIEVVFFRVIR